MERSPPSEAAAVLLVLVVAAGCGQPTPEPVPTREVAVPPSPTATEAASPTPVPVAECNLQDPEVIASGQALFNTTREDGGPDCAFCHRDGRTAPEASNYGEIFWAPSLVGVFDRHSEMMIRTQIMEGGGRMPQMRQFVDDETALPTGCTELDEVVAFLGSLGSGEIVSEVAFSPDPDKVAAGEDLFASTCEVCHVDGGRSEGQGQPYDPQPPALAGVMQRHHPIFVRQMIRFGRGNMPPYAETFNLSDEDTEDLLSYLRALSVEAG